MTNNSLCDLDDFRNQYKNIHGYLSLTVCIFGSIANIFNICVLRTKQMRSPTNFILIGLAVADLLVMLVYTPFTIHRNIDPRRKFVQHFSYAWACFYKFHAFITIVLHSIACFLTIILAIWRYIFVSKVSSHGVCSNLKYTVIVIILTYVIAPLICFPLFSTFEIKPYNHTCKPNGEWVLEKDIHLYENKVNLTKKTMYVMNINDPQHLSIWLYGILLKFVPCVLLTVLTYKIITALLETRRRRMKLLASNNQYEEMNGKHKHNTIQMYKENQADRTTKMLVTVLLLFLITEIPQVIIGIGAIGAIFGEMFLADCYKNLGDVMDMMALTNSAINFILYCTMSRQFRVTFREMFRVKMLFCCHKRRPTPEEQGVAETKMSLV
ncbi:hypothetical protein NQ315_004557 [Exocentrus adspersus]|uniref:G-protein coupled receptors family 1 profile domain-containing protein n=1 Tax=Exocentrus adspersus TaxID=1586481 RepID=A0AAV8VP23_9CUCU|nr:hypothetical protein NQ315_004557 [Exocentrus adspersus]